MSGWHCVPIVVIGWISTSPNVSLRHPTPQQQVSSALKQYADTHTLAIVTTNHIVDAIDNASHTAALRTTAGLLLSSSGRQVVPALGLAWASCTTTRLFVSRVRSQHDAALGEGVLRHLQVVYSPFLAQQGCFYEVQQQGVFGVEGTGGGVQQQYCGLASGEVVGCA